MKIGIACYPTVGGSGILATELGLALAARGHTVHFLSYADPPRLTRNLPRVHTHRVQVSAYPLFKYPPYDLALASKMREVMETYDLDVLHVHYAIPHAICAYLARQMLPESKAGIVLTLHGTDITVVGSDPAYRAVTRFGIDQADIVVAVSEYLAQETRLAFSPEKPIRVVPNFVDIERFKPAATDAAATPRPILGHLSNFRPVKRPLDVVRAFASIRTRCDARLWLIGDGPELPQCLALARELGVGEFVEPLGVVKEPETILPALHLLLQPSGSESFGLAALEAMACGVPVVGYRVGGLPEVVVDGENGYLVPFQSVDLLAERAATLLENPELRLSFARAARARAVSMFSMERSVAIHEDLYRTARKGSLG